MNPGCRRTTGSRTRRPGSPFPSLGAGLLLVHAAVAGPIEESAYDYRLTGAYRLTGDPGSDIRNSQRGPVDMRVVPDPEGGLDVSLPPDLAMGGRLEILGLDGRCLASFAASTRIHWSPRSDERSGSVWVALREGERTLAARMAILSWREIKGEYL